MASTGQILQDLAEGMKNDFEVSVICAVPSYTGTILPEYQDKRLYREEINGVKIIRLPVPAFSKSSKKSRIKNLLSYFYEARKVTHIVPDIDYIFAISQPPILGGMLGLYAKKIVRTIDGKRPKLIYCIQDFNPEQIEAIGYTKNKFLLYFVKWLDKRSCAKSDLVITVGRDLVETLKSRFYGVNVPKCEMINNWIDEKKIYPLESNNSGVISFKNNYGLQGKFVIMYSGNIGLYYDLEGIVRVIEYFKNAKTQDNKDVIFVFAGYGALLDKLVSYVKKNEINNILFIPYQDKEQLIYSLNSADVHFCVNAKGIKGVSCPSKFYGIIGVGKPILAVLEQGSEIELLIREIGCGIVSEPGDYEAIKKSIQWFIDRADSNELRKMGKLGYDYLIANLTKDISVNRYIELIKKL